MVSTAVSDGNLNDKPCHLEDLLGRSQFRPIRNYSSEDGNLPQVNGCNNSSDDELSNGTLLSSLNMNAPRHQSPSNVSVPSFMSTTPPVEEQQAIINQEILVFAGEVSDQLFCMICCSLFRDPVITSCGHTFCRTCVGPHIRCPRDKSNVAVVVGNIAIKEQTGEVLIHCKYGCKLKSSYNNQYEVDPDGCPEIIKCGTRTLHEAECGFRPVTCPNNSACGSMLYSQLNAHLEQCNHAKCPNYQFSCTFMGTAQQLDQHRASCPYEAFRPYMNQAEMQIVALKQDVKEKGAEIALLRSRIDKLSDRINRAEHSFSVKISMNEEKQFTLSQDLIDTKRSITMVKDEISLINARLNSGAVGPYDPQQIFKCKGTFVGHTKTVWCLRVYGDWLISGCEDHKIKIWDTCTNFKCIRTLEGHSSSVLALATHSNRLFSGSADCRIIMWDLSNLTNLKSIIAHDDPISALACGNNMLFSGSNRVVKVWDIHTLRMKQEIHVLNHWVRAMATNDLYLFCGANQTIRMYSLEKLECVCNLQVQEGAIYSLIVTNGHVICGTIAHIINVWDIETFEHVGKLTGHMGIIYALGVLQAPGSTKLFSASGDHTIRVWSLEQMICSQALIRHTDCVTSLVVSRGSIYSGAADTTVKVWQ